MSTAEEGRLRDARDELDRLVLSGALDCVKAGTLIRLRDLLALAATPSPDRETAGQAGGLDEEALALVRRWLDDPEWPRFGPGIGHGPFDAGRMAARAAVEQVIAALAEPES